MTQSRLYPRSDQVWCIMNHDLNSTKMHPDWLHQLFSASVLQMIAFKCCSCILLLCCIVSHFCCICHFIVCLVLGQHNTNTRLHCHWLLVGCLWWVGVFLLVFTRRCAGAGIFLSWPPAAPLDEIQGSPHLRLTICFQSIEVTLTDIFHSNVYLQLGTLTGCDSLLICT